MIALSVGSKYPLQLPPFLASGEGAAAQFLTKSGNLLQIFMPDLLKSEIKSIKKNPPKIGLIVDLPLILLVFKFDDGLIFDCPYDARLLHENGKLELPDLTKEKQRIAFDLHLVDSADMTIRALKLITLSPGFTRQLLDAVDGQLASFGDIHEKYQKYQQIPLVKLTKITEMFPTGK